MALVFKEFRVAPCEECGMDAVNHSVERFSIFLDNFMARIFRPLDGLVSRAMSLLGFLMDKLAPPLVEGMVKIGLALKLLEADDHSSETAQALWTEARRRGIDMWEVRPFGLPRRQFLARHGRKTIIFEGLPRTNRVQKSLGWIDDKARLKKKFQAAGFPVAPGGIASSHKQALRVFDRIRKPVIVKPKEGSGGRHTFVGIQDEQKLLKALDSALLIAPAAIIEEQFHGPVFRATLVDGKLVAVLRRDPPMVIGDGVSTVEELVKRENGNPLRRGPVFAEINLDSPVAIKEMESQEISPASVALAGRQIRFHFKVNWGVGGTSRDATLETHPENKELFEAIGSYLGEDIVGIDFMAEDISRSWQEQLSGIIECNSLPLIGNHHFPYTGPSRNVAGDIWDMVFPKSKI